MSLPQLPPPASPDITAAPPQHLKWYGRFWDVMSILVFSVVAINTLASDWGALTWQHWVVFGLSLAQGGLYLFCVSTRGWPIARRWLALYFTLGPTLWIISGLLLPTTWWLGMTYFGQMFGLLSPRVVVPASFIINCLIVLYIARWDPANITADMALGFFFQWLAGMAVYLFIFTIIRTSQGRGQLIAKLEAAQRELEAARQKDVELAALRERERLARDLHDSLGHALAVMAVQLEAIQRLYKVDPQRGSEHVDELKALARRSMDDLRRSLDGLRASGLSEQALTEALQTLSIETGQRANLQIQCRVAAEADVLSPAITETLWRVAQESLANVEKHAQARQVELGLEVQPEAIVLSISDDGVGLSRAAENQRGHYGLRGMRERVESLGGTLTVNGAGSGTRVEARLPLVKARRAGEDLT
jgi:signal transduction histidine kinase